MKDCTCLDIATVGQVPGAIYNAQVVTESGAGLYAGWIFLDKNGVQITSDLVTDSTGHFHYTVPETNYQDIFIQIYSTKEYETVVKSFDELVADPIIVLKKIDPNKMALLPLALIGAGLYLMKRPKQKSVGKTYTQYIERIKSTKPGTKLLIAGGAIVAVYFLLKYKPTPQQKQYLAEAKKRLDELAQKYGIVPSLPIAQFASFVNQLTSDFDGCGNNENNIYRVFEQLNNEADIYQLIVSFDIAKFDGCFEGSLPSWNVHYTLSEAINSDLTGGEVSHVNSILNSKGINFYF